MSRRKLFWYQVSYYATRAYGQTFVTLDFLCHNKKEVKQTFDSIKPSGVGISHFAVERVGTHEDYIDRLGVDGQLSIDFDVEGQQEVSDEEYWGEGGDPSLHPSFFEV